MRDAWTDAEAAIDQLLARLERQPALLEQPAPPQPALLEQPAPPQPALAPSSSLQEQPQQQQKAPVPAAPVPHQDQQPVGEQPAELQPAGEQQALCGGSHGSGSSHLDVTASTAPLPVSPHTSAAWTALVRLGDDGDDDDDEADLELLRKYRLVPPSSSGRLGGGPWGGSAGRSGSPVAVRGWLYDVDD